MRRDHAGTRADLIGRLLRLRHAKEQRALGQLVRCEGDCRRAERQVAAARDTVVGYAAQARARERQLVDGLIGRPVSVTAIARLQAELDALVAKAARLRELLEVEQTALQSSRQARAAANERYRLCQRATIKLDHIAKQERRAAARYQAARDEAEGQPDAGGARADTQVSEGR